MYLGIVPLQLMPSSDLQFEYMLPVMLVVSPPSNKLFPKPPYRPLLITRLPGQDSSEDPSLIHRSIHPSPHILSVAQRRSPGTLALSDYFFITHALFVNSLRLYSYLSIPLPVFSLRLHVVLLYII